MFLFLFIYVQIVITFIIIILYDADEHMMFRSNKLFNNNNNNYNITPGNYLYGNRIFIIIINIII